MGRNGRGKTTLLNLLLGKYEYTGKILSSVQFDYFPYPEKHPLTLVIKDKNKDVVASYPFFIQYNELYQPQN